jgi:DNA-binding transcriptional LysR family regulator
MSTNHNFPLFNEMIIFTRVVEAGSFSEAARQLGTTPSAVSRSIARLEQQLNTRLLQRTTRKLRLSDSGEDAYKHCLDMLNAASAVMEVSGKFGSEPEGKIRISAPRALGRFLIHPYIPEFLTLYPKVDIVLRLEDRYVDLIDEQLDLAFRITDEPPPGLMGRPLTRIEQIICATPDYLARYGTPSHPHDLKRHSCIALGEDAVDSRWRFIKNGKSVIVDINGRYTVNHTRVRLEAVLENLGVGAIPYFIARDAMQQGLITQVLPEWTFKTNYQGDAWILYPFTRHLPPKIRLFIDFIAAKLSDETKKVFA